MRLETWALHVITNFVNSDKVIHAEVLLFKKICVRRKCVICKIILTLDRKQRRNQSGGIRRTDKEEIMSLKLMVSLYTEKVKAKMVLRGL